ncbi:MAG TPA: pyrroline-5-carboxylate reductase [Solirubrobacter sp.]
MRIGLIGSGNMAGALARGWGDPVLATDHGSGRARALVAELGGEAVSNREAAERAELLILGHKPAQLELVAAEIGELAQGIVVSIVAGASIAEVEDLYPNATVFRVLPNTPVALRKGVLLFAQTDEEGAEPVKALFARVGTVIELPEKLMRVGNSISGVGPAYWALLAEAWTDSAIRHGMPAAQAATLVRETMAGTAALLNDTDTLALRRGVTSPGGTTARGLNALEQGGVRAALAHAMDAVVGA